MSIMRNYHVLQCDPPAEVFTRADALKTKNPMPGDSSQSTSYGDHIRPRARALARVIERF